MPKHVHPLIFLAGTALLSGCSFETLAVRSMDGILDNAMDAIMEEGDLPLAEQSIAGDLKLLDGLVRTDPDNEKLLLLACQGYTSYSLAFAEDSAARAAMFYNRARDYGIRGLKLRGIPDSVFRSTPAALDAALRTLSPDDVPTVFWTANAWGSAVNLERDNPDAVANMPLVNAMMFWVKDHDSTFFYGGPLLYFGAYYGSLPAIFGGDTTLSRRYFERAIAVSGGRFLMTLVFYAKTYAVQSQNEPLFRSLLARVIEAPADILPEQRLANAIAKSRARQLLARVSDFF